MPDIVTKLVSWSDGNGNRSRYEKFRTKPDVLLIFAYRSLGKISYQ